MDIAIRIVGLVITLMGMAYLIRPDLIKRLMKFFKQGRRIYLPGLLRLGLAVVFLRGARECRYFPVVFGAGLIFLAGGALIFVLGPMRIRWILEWYEEQPPPIFRVIASVVWVFGAVIFLSA